MPFFPRDGLSFHCREAGEGVPFVFQHGLGGDVDQPFGVFQPPAGFRMLAFDCRAHGETRPLGDPEKIGIAAFADDLGAFLDHLHIERAIVGGISMGAAIALNFAVRYPERVLGLVQSRPAWTELSNEGNVRRFGEIALLIREHGPEKGLEIFRATTDHQIMLERSPDCAESLVKQFQHPRAEETVIKLERIPKDLPITEFKQFKSIAVPTLVLANHKDPIHPFRYGRAVAVAIPGAEFAELTPKSISVAQHTADVQQAVSQFLLRHFSNGQN